MCLISWVFEAYEEPSLPSKRTKNLVFLREPSRQEKASTREINIINVFVGRDLPGGKRILKKKNESLTYNF